MVKRTLSDGELFAQSKNRHELNHLKIKLEEIKYQEIQSDEVNRLERHKWRDFLRTNSRNSGKTSLATSNDFRGDEQDGVWPTSPRSRYDLQAVEKYQRQWVIAYHSHSHNKLYREIEQAGASMQRSLKSPRPVVSVSSASSGDIAGLSKYATAVMGIKRVRNKLDARRPKTSVAEYRNVEIVDINLNQCKPNYTAPWLRKDDESPDINIGDSTSDQLPAYSEECAPPQDRASNKLFESVNSMQAVVKSKDTWRCSICGIEKPSGEISDKFPHTVLVYKGLNKILNNFQSKSMSALQDADVVKDDIPQEPLQQSTSPRVYCRCRKTSVPLNSEKRLSLSSSVSTFNLSQPSANFKSPKSPKSLTPFPQPQQNRRCSRNEDVYATDMNKETNVLRAEKSKKLSGSTIENNKRHTTTSTGVVDVVVTPQTTLVDILTTNTREDEIVNHDNSVLNTDIDTKSNETRTTDLGTSDSSIINEKSNLVLTSPIAADQLKILSAKTQESNCGDSAKQQAGSTTRLEKRTELEKRILKTNETSIDEAFAIIPKSFESNREMSLSAMRKSAPSSKVNKLPKPVKYNDELTIDLKAGELFFQRAAQTMNAKLAEKRSMETLIVSHDKNRPRIVKYETSNIAMPFYSKPNHCVLPNHGIDVKPTNEINGHEETANDVFKHPVVSHNRHIPLHKHYDIKEQSNSYDTSREHVPDKINSTIRAKIVEPSAALIKTSANRTMEKSSFGKNVSGSFNNVLESSPAVENNDVAHSPVQQDRDSLQSAKSKGEIVLPTSAKSYRGNGQQIWKHLEFKGIVIKNYVPPHLRYKTAASDRMKRSISIQGRGAHGDAVVTVHQKYDKSKLVDIIFPKQARQKQLLKMIEENHRKPPSTAKFVADADLRRRIDSFMKSVEPFCGR